MEPNNVNPEQDAAYQAKMEETIPMNFKFKELLVIFNVLTKISGSYGDFMAIAPIVQKIQPLVAVDSNIPKKPKKEEAAVIGTKKES